MTEQLPNFTMWLRRTREGIEAEVGRSVTYTSFERVPRNLVTDEPAYNAHIKRGIDDAISLARMQGVAVDDVKVVALKPEHLQIGDREEMFPQYAKYTNVLYYFGWAKEV